MGAEKEISEEVAKKGKYFHSPGAAFSHPLDAAVSPENPWAVFSVETRVGGWICGGNNQGNQASMMSDVVVVLSNRAGGNTQTWRWCLFVTLVFHSRKQPPPPISGSLTLCYQCPLLYSVGVKGQISQCLEAHCGIRY